MTLSRLKNPGCDTFDGLCLRNFQIRYTMDALTRENQDALDES
ncbi:hypothetical protein [uncultured Nostoc sp.]